MERALDAYPCADELRIFTCIGHSAHIAPIAPSPAAPSHPLQGNLFTDYAISEWLGANEGWRESFFLSPIVPGSPAQTWYETGRSRWVGRGCEGGVRICEGAWGSSVRGCEQNGLLSPPRWGECARAQTRVCMCASALAFTHLSTPLLSGESIISNVENPDAVLSTITGCRQWVVDDDAGAFLENATIRPQSCVDSRPGASFAFDPPALPGLIELLTDPTVPTSYSGLCVSVNKARLAASPYIIDDASGAGLGQAYDGLGANAGEGAARLLFDYPAQQQGEILDRLFLKGAGVGLDILKIEIGGDGQAMQGSTPSHQHFAGETPNMNRGVYGWLAQQAKSRNPALKIYALPWSFPGWLRSGSSKSPLAAPAAAAAYVVSWLQGMQATWGVTVDVVGLYSDYWDAALSPAYVLALRAGLSAAGLPTRIECADSSSGWQCAAAAGVAGGEALFAAVDIFGGHGVPAPGSAPFTLPSPKPLWRTYASAGGITDLLGATVQAWNINEGALGNMSATILWAALCAAYDGQPERNQGLIRADSPASGHYLITPALWAAAHTSALAAPGWRHLKPKAADGSTPAYGSGVLAGSGSYVTRLAPDGSAWSMVIAKEATRDTGRNAALLPELATFVLRGAPLAAAQAAGGKVFVYGRWVRRWGDGAVGGVRGAHASVATREAFPCACACSCAPACGKGNAAIACFIHVCTRD